MLDLVTAASLAEDILTFGAGVADDPYTVVPARATRTAITTEAKRRAREEAIRRIKEEAKKGIYSGLKLGA